MEKVKVVTGSNPRVVVVEVNDLIEDRWRREGALVALQVNDPADEGRAYPVWSQTMVIEVDDRYRKEWEEAEIGREEKRQERKRRYSSSW